MEIKFLITVSAEELSTILTSLYKERDRIAETNNTFGEELITQAINTVLKYRKAELYGRN